MRHFLMLLILALTLHSCSNGAYKQGEMIVGVYCGQCQGDCFQGYRHTGDSVTKVSAKFYNQLKNSSEAEASPKEVKQVKALLRLLPVDIDTYENKYGCPDCHDQCGIYLSLINNKDKKTISIDPDEGNYPKELKAFVTGVKNLKLL